MGLPTTIRAGCIIAHHKREELLANIPGAIPFEYKGTPLVALKHTDTTSLILSNMGFSVDAPVNYSYNYPGPFDPYAHQRETVAAMTIHKRLHVFDDPGLGKSASAIWAADYLMTIGAVKRVLFVVPLSTMRDTWDREMMKLTPHRSCSVLYGSKKKRVEALAKGSDFCVINHHGINVMPEELEHGGFDLIVFDESTAIKNAKTKLWKNTKAIADNARLWLMTGTPTPQSPLDAWGQGRLVNPDKLPRSFTHWKQRVMMQISRFKWVPKKDASHHVNQVLVPCVRHSKDACLDLPPVTYSFREAEMSKAQTKALKELNTEAIANADGKQITAVNAAALVTKALQIAQGHVIADGKMIADLEPKNRYKVLLECVEQTSRKVLVFVGYTAVLDGVHEALKNAGVGVVKVDGRTSKTRRDSIYNSFRNDPEVKVLLAHPQTTAHGLTLIEADTTIWYGPIYNAEYYEQANNRMNRPGQHHPMNVIHIYGAPFERAVYRHLQGKLDFQEAVLSAAELLN